MTSDVTSRAVEIMTQGDPTGTFLCTADTFRIMLGWLADAGLLRDTPPAAVAQGLEQGAHNVSGAGSSPARRTGDFGFDDEGRRVRVIALNGLYVSGVLADDGGGWCWYCGKHHQEATTKRTPCCGDCWYDTAPDDEA